MAKNLGHEEAFKIGNLLEKIQKKSKSKIPFTQEQVNEFSKRTAEYQDAL